MWTLPEWRQPIGPVYEPPLSLSLKFRARSANRIHILQNKIHKRQVVFRFRVFGKRQTVLRWMQVNEKTVAG